MFVRLCLIVIGMLASETALAANTVEFTMNTTIAAGEKVISAIDARIVAEVGKLVTVPANDKNPYELRMVAREVLAENGEQMIEIESEIYLLKNGEAELVSRPRLVTALGQEGLIRMDNDQNESFEVRMTPVKIN